MQEIIELINKFASKDSSDYETEELVDYKETFETWSNMDNETYQETFDTWDSMDDMARQAIDRALWTVKAELARRGY